MAVIISVKDARVKGYISLGVKDGDDLSYYTVSKTEYSSLGAPVRGYEIDCDTVSEIYSMDEGFRARKKALSLLAYADNSERMLRLKLRRAGFSAEAVERAAVECVSLGYVDDVRQLMRLVPVLANKLYGAAYIKSALMKKGYSSSDVSRVIGELVSAGEIDFKENFEKLVEKHAPSTPAEREMLARKYGYRY